MYMHAGHSQPCGIPLAAEWESSLASKTARAVAKTGCSQVKQRHLLKLGLQACSVRAGALPGCLRGLRSALEQLRAAPASR